MNLKLVAVLLLIVSLGLAGGLYVRHTQAVKEKDQDVTHIQQLSNTVVETTMKLEEQKLVNLSLQRDFDAQVEEVKNYSNRLATVTANLEKTRNDAKAAEESAKADLLKRDARIAELESERDDLSKKMTDLTGSINSLESRIAETQRKLEASEGDREFLLKELKRLQAEKAELERQFNDLAVLREQVRRLRDELSISRRLEWIRKGLYGSFMKGAERLQNAFTPPAPSTNYNLDVEIRRDGGVSVAPPGAGSSTQNSPPQ